MCTVIAAIPENCNTQKPKNPSCVPKQEGPFWTIAVDFAGIILIGSAENLWRHRGDFPVCGASRLRECGQSELRRQVPAYAQCLLPYAAGATLPHLKNPSKPPEQWQAQEVLFYE